MRHVTGQEAEPLAGLDRRANQDDAAHLFVFKCINRARDGQVGLAGTGRPDAKGEIMVANTLHIRRLVGAARANKLVARLDRYFTGQVRRLVGRACLAFAFIHD